MKFNLKNRPNYEASSIDNDCQSLVKDCVKWFEGFEKELRERKAKIEKLKSRDEFEQGYDIAAIKYLMEILGEEKNEV